MDWHWARHPNRRRDKARKGRTSRISHVSIVGVVTLTPPATARRCPHTRTLASHPPRRWPAPVRRCAHLRDVLAFWRLALPSTQACAHCTSREPNAHLGPPVAGDLGARARRRRAGALPQAARDPPRPKTRAIAPSPSPPARALGLGPRGAPQLPLGKRGARARRRPLGPIARLARAASLAHRFLPPLRPRSQPNQPLSLINHA